MYLHPNNNGLVPNNHLRLEADMHQLTLFHIKPNKSPLRCSVHLQPAFGHCSLAPIVCIMSFKCAPMYRNLMRMLCAEWWLLASLELSNGIIHQFGYSVSENRREGRDERRGEMILILQMNSQWLRTIKTHDTFLFTSGSWVLNHLLVCDC